MPTPENLNVGALQLKTIPELPCFQSFEELLRAIPELYSIIVPDSITNVIVSNVEPNSDQTTALWIRLSNDGTFIGVYVYTQGQFVQIWPVPNEVIWLYGDSEVPPTGYVNTDNAPAGTLSTGLKASLKAAWIAGNKTPPSYEYYSAIWVGV